MTKSKILVIDDEKLLVKSTCLALNLYGFDSQGAPDGIEGLRRVGEFNPDLILLDIMMPGMDGWAVLEKLKQWDGYQQIPVVIFTAKEYFNGKTMATSRGAADFLPKPYELEELLDVLRKNLLPQEVAA
jgi:two-component system KDP operon response regulator KdpE